MYKRVGH